MPRPSEAWRHAACPTAPPERPALPLSARCASGISLAQFESTSLHTGPSHERLGLVGEIDARRRVLGSLHTLERESMRGRASLIRSTDVFAAPTGLVLTGCIIYQGDWTPALVGRRKEADRSEPSFSHSPPPWWPPPPSRSIASWRSGG